HAPPISGAARRIAAGRPEQPPPCTPTRRPPCSGETPSFSRSARIFLAARSVRWIVATLGLIVSVAIVSSAADAYVEAPPASWSDALRMTALHARWLQSKK